MYIYIYIYIDRYRYIVADKGWNRDLHGPRAAGRHHPGRREPETHYMNKFNMYICKHQ